MKINKAISSISSLIKLKGDNNISIDIYFLMIGILFGSALVFAPQIYIKNNIYYKSRNINKLYLNYQALKDENQQIKTRLKSLKFKQGHQK